MSGVIRDRETVKRPYAPGVWTYLALFLLSVGNLLLDKDVAYRVFVRPFEPDRVARPFALPARQEDHLAAPLAEQPGPKKRVMINATLHPRPFEQVSFVLRNWIAAGLMAVLLWIVARVVLAHWHELGTPPIGAFLLVLYISFGFIVLGNLLCTYDALPGFVGAMIGITLLWAAGDLWRATKPVQVLPGARHCPAQLPPGPASAVCRETAIQRKNPYAPPTQPDGGTA
jgi:hypothetical protein